MAAAYLWLNAAMYLVFAIWCVLRVEQTSKALGYEQLSPAGKTEFVSIYGGMELAIAIIFACLAYTKIAHHLGLVFSVILYGSIVPFRLYGLLRFKPKDQTVRLIALGEVVLLLAPIALLMPRLMRLLQG